MCDSVSAALLFGACLAPAPPIVVETAHGEVRAGRLTDAVEVAALLEDLLPRVEELLPGSQDRDVDIWVQNSLRLFRFRSRPESVRGFTLLSRPFHARRIHLQPGGRTSWYLSHELVHALLDKSWRTLPGLLEEGLADTIAEQLNPEDALSIRAHRLIDASAFTGGVELTLGYRLPVTESESVPARSGFSDREIEAQVRLHLLPDATPETARALLSSSRRELARRWPDLPESFYGFAWLVVDRIITRRGLDGLHDMCVEAGEQGLERIPLERLLAAAEIDLDTLDASFLASSFTAREFQRALGMRPLPFAQGALSVLEPLRERFDRRDLLLRIRPTFRLAGGPRIPLHAVGSLREVLLDAW